MQTRRAELKVKYQGKDISKYINEDMTHFNYNDTAIGVADDVSIELQDREKKWLNDWICNTGDKVNAQIILLNWDKEGDRKELNCGTFTVDTPKYIFSPEQFSLNAISIPANTNFRDVAHSRVWQSVTVKQVAQSIANNAGLSLHFESTINPVISKKEQSEEADMSFLQGVCNESGLILKIYNEKIVIFSEYDYEKKASVITFSPSMLNNIELKRSITDSGYDGCIVRYKKGDDELIGGQFMAHKGGKKILYVSKKVDSTAEAIRLAKNELRQKNKKEYTFTASIPGLTPVLASQCVTLNKEFGQFAGKYFIETVSQSISPTKANITGHRVLNGY